MRRVLLFTLLSFLGLPFCYSQNNESRGGTHASVPGNYPALVKSNKHTGDGSSSLGLTYNRENVCGLNYITASQLVETRTKMFSWDNTGTGLPTSVNLSGLCLANDSILKAYLYWGTSYFGTIAEPAQLSITNPLLNTFNYNVTTIGLAGNKCWGETGTAAYREDVTNCISGNGAYSINITGAGDSAYEVDGVTLIVIYRDPTATYSGSMVIYDGIETSNPGNPYLQTFTGFNVCAATPNAWAFAILSDMQGDENGNLNTEIFNGTSVNYTNDFWNFCNINTSFTSGQNSCVFNTYTNDGGFDCYSWILAGLYWQNTTCMTCTPANSFVSIKSTGGSVCAGDSVLLIGNGAGSYTWGPGGSLSCTSCDSTYAKPNLTTIYTVTATTICGSSTDTLTIHVLPSPTIIVNPPNPGYCEGDSIQLFATGAATYTWTPTTSLSCTNCPDPVASPTATTTYTVTGSNGICNGAATVTVSVGTQPTLTVVPTSATICSGNSVSITVSGASAYLWNPSGSLSCNNCPTPIATPTATTTYTVVGSNGGCTDTSTVIINVNPTPTITASPASPAVCPGDSVQVTVSGASSYKWLNASGISCTGCPNPYLSPTVTTVYTVVGYGNNGCNDTLLINVNVTTTLTVTVVPSSPTVCLGSSVTLLAGGAGNFNWKPSTGLSCTNCFNPIATPTATTTYMVIGSSGSNCEDSAFVTVNVTPVPAIIVSGPDTVCKGASATLTVSGATNYLWSNGNTTTSITVPVVNKDTGYYVLGFDGICYDSIHKNINVYPTLSIVMSPSDTICIGSSTSIKVNVKGSPPYTYVWDNGITWDSAGPISVSPGVQTVYNCTVTDGCGDIASGNVTITPVPNTSLAAFYATPNPVSGGDFVTFVNQSTGASSYYWNFGDGNNSTLYDPINQYNIPGVYLVYLVTTNGVGCPDTAREYVTVTEGFINFPNVFTPNGDGVNDVFHISAGGMQSFHITIYNRWGVLVFESLNPNIDWDGRSTSGIEEASGTYYWVITAKGYSDKEYSYSGFVELIR